MDGKTAIITAIITTIGAIFVALIGLIPYTQSQTEQSVQNETVELLALRFESIDESMRFDEALAEIYNEYIRLTNENTQLTSEVSELNRSAEEELDAQIVTLESEIDNLQAEINTLEYENDNLQAEIDIFIARGEPPVPRNPDGSPASIVSLRNMTNIGDVLTPATVFRDNYSNTYTDVLLFEEWRRPYNEFVFHTILDNRYTRFQGIVFVGYEETRDEEVEIRFELDGRTVDQHTLDKTTRPITIDIDLSDVNEFKMVVTRGPSNYVGIYRDYVEIYFGDFDFYP